MNFKDFITCIYPKTLGFKLAYCRLMPAPRPITLTFSVTNLCQSKCKTCNIWKIYPEKHQSLKDELTIDEIRKIFKSMGRVYFFNISGGEPFLRKDLPEIVEAAIDYLKPTIIHSPTNALAPEKIAAYAEQILKIIKEKSPRTVFTVKPSLDGIGHLHDEIRGVEGNWEKLLETIKLLKAMEGKYDNFHLEIGTVVSNFNKEHLDEIEEFVHSLGIQSYRNEIAEQRQEFLNIGDPITPTAAEYAELMTSFAEKVRENLRKKRSLAKVTESLRLVYYDLAIRIVKEERQVIPCFGGISNVHLTPHGDLWPCCVLGYSASMGNLRDSDYDFWKVWRNAKATEIRKSIRNKECYCPLANQSYSNIICNTKSLLKAMYNIFYFMLKK